MIPRRWIAGLAIVLSLPVSLKADTLYLRNGQRVEGELIGIPQRPDRIRRAPRLRRQRARCGSIATRSIASTSRIPRYSNNNNNSSNLAGGRPSGMRERQVIVSADVAWNDTGIDVRAGQTMYFEAQGRVRWGRDRQDGPAGERNSPSNPNRPMGNRNAAALIGKIGNDMFFIGDDTGPVRMRAAGRLYLGVNDDVLTDNSGNFRVVVYY